VSGAAPSQGGHGELTEQKVLRDRYRLKRRIGFGGMGAVYYARDELLDRPVAVKELRSEYATDELLRKRFIREAQAAGGLSHPHIVTVFDLVEQGPTLFIVMEYLDGGTVLDRMNMADLRRLDVRFTLDVTRDALLGLEAAHEAGLVHRDIKPGNLLFDSKGRVKIADFGVVRTSHADDMTALTSAGGHPGTLVYMSPEQIDGAEVDGRSDVYSMGAVLYECLAGARYFEHEGLRRTERALMDAICELPPVPLRSRVPYVSEEVELLVHSALEKNCEDRPPAGELAARIQSIRKAPRERPSIIVPGRVADTPRPPTQPLPGSDPESETSQAVTRGETHPATAGIGETRTSPLSPQKILTPPTGVPARPAVHDTLDDSRRFREEHPTLPQPPSDPVARDPRRSTERLIQVHPETPPSTTRRPATTSHRRNKDGALMVRIPAGDFVMGSSQAADERPARRVSLDSFCIDRVPVTVGLYRLFLEAIDSEGPPIIPLIRRLFSRSKDHRPTGWDTDEYREVCPSEDHPVVRVDWFDAYAYAHWTGARLPTEAEWERAARGVEGRPYTWGDQPPTPELATFGRMQDGPTPVGARAAGASPEGVADLLGNVWEWCLDRYDPEAYQKLPVRNPYLEMTTEPRIRAVKRGGSWTNAAHSLRGAKRGFEYLAVRRDNLGFRCAVAVS
jgi:eukaryotic-like serine/threonine-protein kinase